MPRVRRLLLVSCGLLALAEGNAHAAFEVAPIHPTATRYAVRTVADPVAASEWIEFNSTDPETGAHIWHARVIGTPSKTQPSATGPGIFLEVQQKPVNVHSASIILSAWKGACPTDISLAARFDDAAPIKYGAHGKRSDGRCVLAIDTDRTFDLTLLNTDTLLLAAPPLFAKQGDVAFHVRGLSWPE